MVHQNGPLVKRLRQRPLTPLTWVRFPHGSPKYSSLAQSVEHAAVNRRVVGSSPTGGASKSSRIFDLRIFLSIKSHSLGEWLKERLVSIMNNTNGLSYTKWNCKYHIVLSIVI